MSQGVNVVNAGTLTENIVDEPMVLFWRVQVADEQKPPVSSHTLGSINLGRFQWVLIWSKLHNALKHSVKRAPEGQLDVLGSKALLSNHIPGEECQHVEASNMVRAIFEDRRRRWCTFGGHESIPVTQQGPILMA